MRTIDKGIGLYFQADCSYKCKCQWSAIWNMQACTLQLQLPSHSNSFNSSEFRIFLLMFSSCSEDWASALNLLLVTYYSDLLFWIKLRNICNSSYCDLLLLTDTQHSVYICHQHKRLLIQIIDGDRNSSSAVLSSIETIRHRLTACCSKPTLRRKEELASFSSDQIRTQQPRNKMRK